ncbi:ead/Ea22-like family protein [Salmonella enterica]
MTIDKRALREVAEKATKGPWKVFSDIDTKTFSIHTPRDKRCENVIKWGGFDCQPNAEANAEFIAAFNPKVALALLDEVESAEHTAAVDHEAACSLVEENEELKRRITEMESKNSNLRTIAHEQNELAIRANLDSINDAVEMDRLHKRIAELEAREISLPERSSMLYRTDFHEDYHTVMAYKVSDVIAAIRAAGIKVKGE